MELTKKDLELIHECVIESILNKEKAMDGANPSMLHFWNLSTKLSHLELLKVKINSYKLSLNAKIDGN